MIQIVEYEGYQIKPDREVCTCYIIVTSGKGGKIPDILSGLYTSRVYAKEAIDKYLASKPKKESNDEKGNKG